MTNKLKCLFFKGQAHHN